eukprot:6459766-Prymnesium_polylepis.2
MGSHGCHLTCLGASLLVPAPHSLRTARQFLGRRAHVLEWWFMIHVLASYGAPTALEVCIEHCRGGVSGGIRSQPWGPSAYTNDTVLYGFTNDTVHLLLDVYCRGLRLW